MITLNLHQSTQDTQLWFGEICEPQLQYSVNCKPLREVWGQVKIDKPKYDKIVLHRYNGRHDTMTDYELNRLLGLPL